jgi:hypothetical protein
VTIRLVLPRAESRKACLPFEIRRHLDAALLPRKLEIGVLKGVVEADLAGFLEARAEIDVVERRAA